MTTSQNETTTDPDLGAIAARADAASKGPWQYESAGFEIWTALGIVAEVGGDADRAFIAHARRDVPALIAEVRRLSTENTILQAQLSRSVLARLRAQGVIPSEAP